MISIILPYYNRYDLVHQRLNDIFSFLPAEVEVIIVDDASTDINKPQIDLIKWWHETVFPQYGRTLRYVRNKVNLGFGGSMNVGVQHARGNIIVLLSSDVIIRGDFTKQLETIINLDSNVLVGGRIVYWDSGWNRFNFDGKDTTIVYCEGWFLACTKEVWNDLGGFDPIYAPYDYEDIDLSLTAVAKGYKLVAMNSGYLEHLSGQTIATVNPNRQAITDRNKIRFYDKWKEEVPEIFKRLENVNNGEWEGTASV